MDRELLLQQRLKSVPSVMGRELCTKTVDFSAWRQPALLVRDVAERFRIRVKGATGKGVSAKNKASKSKFLPVSTMECGFVSAATEMREPAEAQQAISTSISVSSHI